MRAADLIINNTSHQIVGFLGRGQQILMKGLIMMADLAGFSLTVRGNAGVQMCFC